MAPVGSVVARAIAFGVACLALATCTPPNFGPPDSGEPLTIAPLQPELVAGTSFTFTVAGGHPTYSFEADDGTISSGGRYTAPPYPPADDTDTVRVRDSAGHVAETVVSIKPTKFVISPAIYNPLFVGEAITITASGGKPAYAPVSAPGGTLESTGPSTWRYTASSTGSHTLTFRDSSGTTQFGTSTIQVVVAPTELTISPTDLTLGLGDTFQFGAGGGTSPYTYAWVSGVGGSSDMTSAGLYTANHVGDAVVKVVDSSAGPEEKTAMIHVNYPPLQINPTTLNLARNAGWDFDATGGNSQFRFSIVSGGGSIDLYSGVFTAPAAPGTTVIQVDDTASSLPSQATINVYAPLVVSPKPATVNAGTTQTFTASGGVPGAGGAEYTFSLSPVSGAGSLSPTKGLSTVYTAPPSTGSATLMVTDSIGNLAWTDVVVVDPAQWAPAVTVDTASGQYASLALSGAGDPYIAYLAGLTLKLARWSGTAFVPEIVDNSGDYPGQFASLALDASDRPRISYYYSKVNKDALGYAAWNGTKWSPKGKVTGTEQDGGKYTSLALDPTDNNNPRVAYYDTDDKNLNYATFNGTTWTISAVDSAGDVGQFASLRLATSGSPRYPRIAYYDKDSGDLRYAWRDSGGWHYETPDSAGDVGQYASLCLDAGGDAHIAYYDASSHDLKYVHQDAGVWQLPETVDSTDDVGQYASLALNGEAPRIAYFDATHGYLKYASWNGSVWVIVAIDKSGTAGKYASLALDGSGKMRVAYFDSSGAGKLKYLRQQ